MFTLSFNSINKVVPHKCLAILSLEIKSVANTGSGRLACDIQVVTYKHQLSHWESYFFEVQLREFSFIFRRAVNLYPYRKCLGTREVLREEDEMQPNGRVFKKLVCGEYSWLTYAEVDARARAFGCGIAALGQQLKENIVLFSETKAEWMIAAQGCFAQNFPSRF